MALIIQQLDLSPQATNAALFVREKHPDVVFTSGRRSIEKQALVMAQNAVRHGGAWLKDTYKNTRMVACLMTYMEENPELCSSPAKLGQGFYEQLQEHFTDYFNKFAHVRGDAFDIAWPRLGNGLIDRPRGEALCKTIESLPQHGIALELLLRKEGALDVIHAQFRNI